MLTLIIEAIINKAKDSGFKKQVLTLNHHEAIDQIKRNECFT